MIEDKLNVSFFQEFDCMFAIDLEQKDVERLKNQLIKINNHLMSL